MHLDHCKTVSVNFDRIDREKDFHNQLYEDDATRGLADNFYSINSKGNTHYNQLISQAAERRILEYGCGVGSVGFKLAGPQLDFEAIDISEVAIEKCSQKAKIRGIDPYCDFHVMNAEELTWPDQHFSTVFGAGILHHLDLGKSLAEIYRVLEPGGSGIFIEPLGVNPVINWYRNRTPDIRTPDEHPLLRRDIAMVEDMFDQVNCHFYYLTSLGAGLLKNSRIFKPLSAVTGVVDQALLKLPVVKYWAWQVLIEAKKAP